MARRESHAERVTVYRISRTEVLRDAVRVKYLDDPQFQVRPTTVGGREALLLSGRMTTPEVSWAATLESLAGTPLACRSNVTAAAALLIRSTSGTAWAITYGMGFHLLEAAKVDTGFGQRMAIRIADPGQLRSITRTTLDQRSRTDRLSIPGGTPLWGFDIEDFGEIVSRVAAAGGVPTLTAGAERGGKASIRGSDSLSIPLGRTAATMLADLDELDRILTQPPQPGLETLEQLVRVKSEDLLKQLWGSLEGELGQPNPERLGLSWPHERVDEHGTASSFKLHGAGRQWRQDGLPALDDILRAVVGASDPIGRLHALKITLHEDGPEGRPISQAIPLSRWLAYETDIDRKRYCLSNGSWYVMDEEYAGRLRLRVDQIFSRRAPIALPPWDEGIDEAAYNQAAAVSLGGTLLDKSLIRTTAHRRGIEPCDILTKDGELIHVKVLKKSTAASHLLSQAYVSAHSLLYDQEARQELRSRLSGTGHDPFLIDGIRTVVLGIAQPGKTITSMSLFSFTQVTLVRLVTDLEGRGLNVFVVPIEPGPRKDEGEHG